MSDSVITIPCELGTEIAFKVFRGGVLKSKHVQRNMILSSGILAANIASNLSVGTGTTPPAYSDTKLESVYSVASPAPVMTSSKSIDLNTGIQTGLNKFTYTYSEGAVIANLSEFGIGASPTTLHTRALIRNNNGDPVVISLKSTDTLIVEYTLQCSLDSNPIPITINYDGTTINATAQMYLGSYGGNEHVSGVAAGIRPGSIIAQFEQTSLYAYLFDSNLSVNSQFKLASNPSNIGFGLYPVVKGKTVGDYIGGNYIEIETTIPSGVFNSQWKAITLLTSPGFVGNSYNYYNGGLLINFVGPQYITKTVNEQIKITVKFKALQA